MKTGDPLHKSLLEAARLNRFRCSICKVHAQKASGIAKKHVSPENLRRHLTAHINDGTHIYPRWFWLPGRTAPPLEVIFNPPVHVSWWHRLLGWFLSGWGWRDRYSNKGGKS